MGIKTKPVVIVIIIIYNNHVRQQHTASPLFTSSINRNNSHNLQYHFTRRSLVPV
jgi:hypothetical protein